MTTTEFSNEFDLLWDNLRYNNSNYAALNEYEKSVFLTQAQEELIKNYFNPKGNKYQDGFDGSDKRDMDFSNLIKTSKGVPVNGFNAIIEKVSGSININSTISTIPKSGTPQVLTIEIDNPNELATFTIDGVSNSTITVNLPALGDNGQAFEDAVSSAPGVIVTPNSLSESIFQLEFSGDLKVYDNIEDRIIKYSVGDDVFFIINESLSVNGSGKTIKPISLMEYDKLSSKVYFEPPKRICWRLMSEGPSSDSDETYVELLPHTADISNLEYKARYIKRPQPIVLEELVGASINGVTTVSDCELNPIIHREILSRAVILAKNAVQGDLNSDIQLEQRAE